MDPAANLCSHCLQVGGVQFKPKAWTDKLDTELRANHDIISKAPGTKRGANFALWDHGQMVSLGSRQPAGGIKGDGYREYPIMEGKTVKDIQTLLRYAAVSVAAIHDF